MAQQLSVTKGQPEVADAGPRVPRYLAMTFRAGLRAFRVFSSSSGLAAAGFKVSMAYAGFEYYLSACL